MKFGVLQFFSWPERRIDLATVYARALDRILIMERGGYDAVWLPALAGGSPGVAMGGVARRRGRTRSSMRPPPRSMLNVIPGSFSMPAKALSRRPCHS
jgi:hypothetical protein